MFNGKEAFSSKGLRMDANTNPLAVIIAAFIISSLAGVAQLLRSARELTLRTVLAEGMNAGAIGTALAMLLFTYFKDDTWFLLGLCLLAGVGGMTMLGLILAICRKGGIDVHIDVKDSDDLALLKPKKKKKPEPKPKEDEENNEDEESEDDN